MDYDYQHRRNIQKYIKEVEIIFNKLIARTSSVVLRAKLRNELFKFKKYPKITKDINLILNEYYESLLSSINVGISNEWQLANEKIDTLKTLQLKKIADKVSQEVLALELSKIARSPRNTEALLSFQQRKINGFTISDRVWKITEQMRDELEFAIDVSLVEGKSANELAREIKKHLNNPDGLYRRVRDKHGNLVLSRNAKNFHPGQGVYRSSHKNALRLTKEEINTAYRESESLRIMQNNDVVGIEIHLSPSHKIYDICDELAGKYPKDFKWNKWHIGCMCHRRVIMKSEEELVKELQNGENLLPESSSNFVADVPKNFKQWHKDNEYKFENWKRKPSFLEENKGYWDYKTSYISKNGSRVLVNSLADKSDLYKNLQTAKLLSDKLGIDVKIRPHSSQKGVKNPEYEILGKIADRKEQIGKNVSSNLKSAKNQKCKIVVFDVMNEYPYDIARLKNNLKGIVTAHYHKDTFELFYIIKNNAIEIVDVKEWFL